MRVLRFIAVICVVAVFSCGKDTNAPPLLGPPADVAGSWTFSQMLGNQDIYCEGYGTLVLNRADANLTGTATQTGACAGPSDTVSNSGTAALTGSVGLVAIRIRFGGCEYEGNLLHIPVDAAEGFVTCRVRFGVASQYVAGTWEANLVVAPPSVSGSIAGPSGDTVAVGDSIRMTLSASDPRGLTWVGYNLFPAPNLADSLLIGDTVVVDTIYVTAQASWVGTSYLHVWAKNRYGKFSGTAGMPITVR